MLTVNVNPGRPHAVNEMFTMLNFFHGTRQRKRTEHATSETAAVWLLYLTASEQTETGCMQYTSLN